ncbi:unnamed protein product [Clavelina lepadiformis]|uniref:Uncharacterized protein n=1 Tax=Clavelina lepadiformis TaxID=159417 RepID=A0ABP0G7P9_CLALP
MNSENCLKWNPKELESKVRKVVDGIVWIKVVALGNTGTGKTCLIKHFCESKFSNCYHATVGVDYGFKIQTVKEIPLRVHLWDFSGDSQYYDIRSELYSGTDACFLVFDVTNQASFQSLDGWLRETGRFGALNSVVVVVGNKADLRSNKNCVSAAEARKWASTHKLQYFETSAFSGDGVSKLFEELLGAVVSAKKINLRPATSS